MSSRSALAIYPSMARPEPQRGRPRRVLGRLALVAVSLLVALAAVVGGIGWLYLLRRAAVLDVGPRLPDALPLQRLAGGAAQPLLRLMIAWLPAGLAAGVALRAAGMRNRATRAAVLFVATAVLLVALGAAADAVTASESISRHLGSQPHRVSTWLAAVLVAAGAALPGRRP